MTLIKIDREMLVEELYRLRALLRSEDEEARQQVDALINLVKNAPTDETKAALPRIGVRRG